MGRRIWGGRFVCGALLAAAVTVTGIAPVAADTDLVVGGTGVVSYTNGDGVNFRDAVGYSANIISHLPEGASVHVIGGPLQNDEDGSLWYNVDVNGTLGWIVSDFLSRQSTSAGQWVVVSGTDGHGLRLRDGASSDSATLVVMPEGSELQVVEGEVVDGAGVVWAKVSYNGAVGYASRDYLVEGSGAAQVQTSAPAVEVAPATNGLSVGMNAEITGTNGVGLNLRYDASYGSGVAAIADEGHVVNIIDGPAVSGDVTWWGVDYKGTRGWMHGGYLSATDREATQAAAPVAAAAPAPEAPRQAAPAASSIGEQIAATAMQYLGYPYVWGATGPNGFDCSGFTYFVVNQVIGGGFSRDMEVQAASGSYVDPSDLQPGDLVFQQNTYKWGLSHVGIYIGDGKFVNAATENVGVVVSNLWDSYWGQRYYTARRIG